MSADDPGRRRWLVTAAAGLAPCIASIASPAWAGSPADATQALAASWADGAVFRAGVLAAVGGRIVLRRSIDLPTRAHGLLVQADGTLIVVSRRPGDWLLHWWPHERKARWVWAEPGRSFNGHAVLSADGSRIFTTETDTDTGASLIGVRDAARLNTLDEWPAYGIDAHQLLVDGDSLLVANGGIETRPETGRVKHDRQRMDSSLVRLDARSGALRAQWRLADPRLSLRHLAANGPLIGVALQAEHDDDAARAAAPVLAVLYDAGLQVAGGTPDLRGYGGDIAAWCGGFVVSSPRAGAVGHWQPGAGWSPPVPLAEACALSTDGAGLLIGGQPAAARLQGDTTTALRTDTLRLDNHWLRLETLPS